MNEWKMHKFLLLFSGARTRDSCVRGSHAIHSATGVHKEQKFVPFSFIHNPPLSLFNRFCELSALLLLHYRNVSRVDKKAKLAYRVLRSNFLRF